jgi:hypothetical protein
MCALVSLACPGLICNTIVSNEFEDWFGMAGGQPTCDVVMFDASWNYDAASCGTSHTLGSHPAISLSGCCNKCMANRDCETYSWTMYPHQNDIGHCVPSKCLPIGEAMEYGTRGCFAGRVCWPYNT